MTKKLVTIIVMTLVIYNVVDAQDDDVGGYQKLKIGYDHSLPENVHLGVNGSVFIQEGQGERRVKSSLRNYFLLTVEGGILSEDLGIASKDIWLADYVFEPDYKLPSLQETKTYVQKYKHLPGIIGQKEIEKQGYYGMNNMLIGQLKNIEELLLHTIAQEEKIEQLEQENAKFKALVVALEKRLTSLENKNH